jgi:muconolactone D-isomerase
VRHFLVHTIVTLPDGDAAALAELRVAETVRAEQLQRDGSLVAIWREAGRLASFGIWRGNDPEFVRSLVASLPMYRYMTVSITELHRHPNSLHAFPFTDPKEAERA